MRRALLLVALFASPSWAADCIVGTKPTRGVACTDATYGTTLNRVTVHSSDIPAATHLVNEYSRKQAYNSDNTKILANSSNGFWLLFNASTYAKIKQLTGPAGDCEPQWHPTDADKFWYLPTNGGLVIYEYTVSTDATATVVDFTGRLGAFPGAARVWTKAEGAPSKDGRYWAFLVQDASFNTLGLFTYDMTLDSIIATITFTETPDHASMTPSGDYVEIEWWSFQQIGGVDGRKRAYTRALDDWTWIDCEPNHGDFIEGLNGNDYYVGIDFTNGGDATCSPANGYVFMLDIQSGFVSEGYATANRVDLFPSYISGTTRSMHFSGRALDLPGYFLISTYGCVGGSCPQTIDDSVILVPLQANPTLDYIGSTFNQYSTYFNEPHASISRDGTRAIFSSNWELSGTADVDVDVYEYTLSTPLSVTTTSLAGGTVSTAYSGTVSTVGGTRPLTGCAVNTGSLPAGLSVAVNSDGDGCLISGTPTGVESPSFVIRATDTDSTTSDSSSLSINVISALAVSTSTLPDGTRDSGYSTCVLAGGGTPPYTWAKLSGSVPTGLTLASTGCFTGTATATGTFQFVARVTDNVAATVDSATLSLTINADSVALLDEPDVQPGSVGVVVVYGAEGLDAAASCTVTLRDSGGAETDSDTTTSGGSRRSSYFIGLTASTVYSVTVVCGGATPDVNPLPFSTLASIGGTVNYAVEGSPASILSGVDTFKVDCTDQDGGCATFCTPTVTDATCGSGCTVSMELARGRMYSCSHEWKNGAAVLATSSDRLQVVQ